MQLIALEPCVLEIIEILFHSKCSFIAQKLAHLILFVLFTYLLT